MKFKVGDRVRITDRSIFNSALSVGDVGTVKEVYDEDLKIVFDKLPNILQGSLMGLTNIELVQAPILDSAEKKPKFAVGDKVKLVSKTGIETICSIGDVGEVISFDSNDNSFFIKFPDGTQWISDRDLELVKEPDYVKIESTQSFSLRGKAKSVKFESIPVTSKLTVEADLISAATQLLKNPALIAVRSDGQVMYNYNGKLYWDVNKECKFDEDLAVTLCEQNLNSLFKIEEMPPIQPNCSPSGKFRLVTKREPV